MPPTGRLEDDDGTAVALPNSGSEDSKFHGREEPQHHRTLAPCRRLRMKACADWGTVKDRIGGKGQHHPSCKDVGRS